MPPPPGTLSTITCLPMASPRYCARIRPSTSTGPPAANGTTMVTGRVGHSCACTTDVAISAASASAAMGAPVLGICSSMNFLIVCAVSYHIGESDRFGNEVAKAVETEIGLLAGAVDADPRAERG